ncbi:MAG: hypothetical protein JWN56_505 [Sphingobacteriales bacterium]|nr:hypothetical protein [Sphingobacteriales bacterium]
MLGVGAYSALIVFLELAYFKSEDNNYLKNFGLMHGVLGFVISLLLVFRTNTAYDRWWEGRKLWGALTNSSRNLAIKLNAFLKDAGEKNYFKLMIPNYAFALKNQLRENEDYHELDPVLDVNHEKHLPNHIASLLFNRLSKCRENGELTAEQLLILNADLSVFTDVCGACERIKNTPIPFAYNIFIKKFIFFFVMTLPLGWSFSLGYLVIPIVMLILYALAGLEIIAEEIENPFGTDANDLPIDQICHNIRKHVGEILS